MARDDHGTNDSDKQPCDRNPSPNPPMITKKKIVPTTEREIRRR